MLEKTKAAIAAKFGKGSTSTMTEDTTPTVGEETAKTDEEQETSTVTKSLTIKQIITRVFAVATPLAVAGGSYFGFEASQVTEIVTEVGVIISGIVGIWFAVKK